MSSEARLPLIRRLLGRPARILHAPWNVGGHPGGLSRAERELGLISDVLVLEQHPYGYPADIDLQIPAAIHGRPEYPGIVREAAENLVNRYDVFHFNFGQTIMQVLDEELKLHTELPMLKQAGKTILVTFQGDDARPPEANPVVNYTETDLEQIEILQNQRRDAMLRYADRVFYLPPDLKQWLPGGEFRPYAHLDPRTIEPVPPPGGDEVVVVHAPSNRAQKGTDYIITAVDGLRAEGVPVRLDLVEGVQHSEALQRYTAADIGIDQLHFGWYGGVAVEMMAAARPVLCRVLDEEPWTTAITPELPIVRTDVTTLADDIRALVEDPGRRLELGAAGRRFVERHHDPRRIAAANLEGIVEIPDPPPSR